MGYPHQPGSPSFEGGAAYESYLDDLDKLRAEIERLRAALESIANNTCCDKCQEAALVAKSALNQQSTHKAANGEDLPEGAAGTTIVNDGRPV